jgi:hypothetical protein
MNCANRYEVQRRIVRVKDLSKSARTSLDHDAIPCGRHGRLYTYAQTKTRGATP